jgi:hypothetical protein
MATEQTLTDVHSQVLDHMMLRDTAIKDQQSEMQSFQALLTHMNAGNLHRCKMLVMTLWEAFHHRLETVDKPELEFLKKMEEQTRRRIEEPAITNVGAISQQVQALAVHVEKTARAVKGNDDV